MARSRLNGRPSDQADPVFATKTVAIIALLLSPPIDAPLFCVDEEPGIGVRQPSASY
jgi:hypothetical protein